jgi:cation diffusion facilitator CzcD-associated flavoprotein CzcO
MARKIETIIVGGGPAGLAVSYYLNQSHRENFILEKAARMFGMMNAGIHSPSLPRTGLSAFLAQSTRDQTRTDSSVVMKSHGVLTSTLINIHFPSPTRYW